MYTDRFGFSRCAVLKLYRHRFGSAPQPGSAGSASWPGPVSPVRLHCPVRFPRFGSKHRKHRKRDLTCLCVRLLVRTAIDFRIHRCRSGENWGKPMENLGKKTGKPKENLGKNIGTNMKKTMETEEIAEI